MTPAVHELNCVVLSVMTKFIRVGVSAWHLIYRVLSEFKFIKFIEYLFIRVENQEPLLHLLLYAIRRLKAIVSREFTRLVGIFLCLALVSVIVYFYRLSLFSL